MKHLSFSKLPYSLSLSILSTLLLFSACASKEYKKGLQESHTPIRLGLEISKPMPVADYVIEIFEDQRGSLWLGSMSRGLLSIRNDSITYYTTNDGLGSNAVPVIVEDTNGVLWLGTQYGLATFNDGLVQQYLLGDSPDANRISALLWDRNQTLWIGTWAGVYQYKNGTFSKFPLPDPAVEIEDYQTTGNWVTSIIQDRNGHIWISRSGYGVCRYDGNQFTHYLKQDGLPSNFAQCLFEDSSGAIWIGTRVGERDHPDPEMRFGSGGLCKLENGKIQQFTGLEGLYENDIYTIYEDKSKTIWIGATRKGVYQYKNGAFKLITHTNRMDLTQVMGLQSMLEDKAGNLWMGFSGGLFTLKNDEIIHVPASYFKQH